MVRIDPGFVPYGPPRWGAPVALSEFFLLDVSLFSFALGSSQPDGGKLGRGRPCALLYRVGSLGVSAHSCTCIPRATAASRALDPILSRRPDRLL